MPDRRACFIGGDDGPWRVVRNELVSGDVLLDPVERVAVQDETNGPADWKNARWILRGVTSNLRYTNQVEQGKLVAVQEGLGRPRCTCAAMIPIRKKAAWWELPQDHRRAILEEQSKHIEVGMRYLPAIARRLYHCRDLGPDEQFDFVTWFEYTPQDAAAFEEMVRLMRVTAEWKYIEAEVDIRLIRRAGEGPWNE